MASSAEAKPLDVVDVEKVAAAHDNGGGLLEQLNPSILVEQESVTPLDGENQSFTINVVRDDKLPGGTKQRALALLISSQASVDEFVYAGSPHSFVQVALAHVAKAFGKRATIFVASQRSKSLSPLSRSAQSLGATIKEIRPPNLFKNVQFAAQQYVNDTAGGKAVLVPADLDSDRVRSLMETAIRKAMPAELIANPPKRLWLAAGTAVILNALAKIWPSTTFMIVQVGKAVWPDKRGLQEDGSIAFESELFIAPEQFTEKASRPPPFPSVSSYDAKIWQFVLQYGQEGDFVWNAGSDASFGTEPAFAQMAQANAAALLQNAHKTQSLRKTRLRPLSSRAGPRPKHSSAEPQWTEKLFLRLESMANDLNPNDGELSHEAPLQFKELHQEYKKAISAEMAQFRDDQGKMETLGASFSDVNDKHTALLEAVWRSRRSLAMQYLTRLQTLASEADAVSAPASRFQLTMRIECLLAKHVVQIDGCMVLDITRKDIETAKLSVTRVLWHASALCAQGFLSFPWKRLYAGDSAYMMANLRAFEPRPDSKRLVPFNIRFRSTFGRRGEPFLPLDFDGSFFNYHLTEQEHDDMDVLVDMFQEHSRLSFKRYGQEKSVLEQWQDRNFVMQSLDRTLSLFERIDARTLRESVHRIASEPTFLRPSLSMSLILFFRAERVLDFCAGMGDRLIGAIAANVQEYRAFATDPLLKHGHDSLINRFVPEDQRPFYDISYTPMEDSPELPMDAYDLVLSSPMLSQADLSQGAGSQQAHDRRHIVNTWLVGVLFRSIRKAWRSLRDGGHCVVHLTDSGKDRLCEPMCLMVVSRLFGAFYRGVICSVEGTARPQPLWVFQKREQQHSEVAESHAARELQALYPEVAAVLESTFPLFPSESTTMPTLEGQRAVKRSPPPTDASSVKRAKSDARAVGSGVGLCDTVSSATAEADRPGNIESM